MQTYPAIVPGIVPLAVSAIPPPPSLVSEIPPPAAVTRWLSELPPIEYDAR